MRTSLSHLPAEKQTEILEILEIIKEEAKPEKVILFGSHAKGDWVEDEYREDGITYTYISDYDFLVVIKKNGTKEQAIISHIENRCEGYKNVVSPIVHDIDYINEGLKIGQYFFREIISEGILLYDSNTSQFSETHILTEAEEKTRSKGYFDNWYPKGISYLKGAEFYLTENELSSGVFLLHQTMECFYSAVLLVFTGYKPKTHNLLKLRSYSKYISEQLYLSFRNPSDDEYEIHLFELLRKGYVDARYKPDYSIEAKELKELIGRVKQISIYVNELCLQKIG